MDNPDDVTVYRMGPGCDLGVVEQGKVYIGRVQGFANFGTFVQLNDQVKGLVHKSNIRTRHKERETILVRVKNIRDNGNIDLEEVIYPVYTVEVVERKSTAVRLADLGTRVGRTVGSRARSPRSSRQAGRPSSPSWTNREPRMRRLSSKLVSAPIPRQNPGISSRSWAR